MASPVPASSTRPTSAPRSPATARRPSPRYRTEDPMTDRARLSRTAEPRPRTLGELRASGWRSRTVKEELRANLLARLAEGRPIFPGVIGYDETVLPAVE